VAARRPWLPSEIPLAPRKPRPLLLALHFEIEKIAHSTGDDAARPTAFSRNGCSNETGCFRRVQGSRCSWFCS